MTNISIGGSSGSGVGEVVVVVEVVVGTSSPVNYDI